MSRIVKLTAQDFKRLVAVEIAPDGNVVVVSGANGHGKTSVLDAITAALVGQQAFRLDQPIRQGAEEAMVELDMGEFVVTRRWKGDKSSLEVRLQNGAEVSSPRRFLDDLIGKLSFDPLAFANADAKEQRKTLLDVAGLADLDAQLSGQRKRWYDTRTEMGRDAKKLTAQLAGLPKPLDTLPTEAVDVAKVVAELTQLQNDEREFERLREQATSIDSEIVQLQQRIADLLKTREGITARGRDLINVERRPQMVDLQQKIEDAGLINQNAERAARREEISRELGVAQDRWQQCGTEIQAIDEKRQQAIAAANLPIPGLGVDDDGVTLNGVPFSQSSAAERMRTSIAIAMRLNPDIRVIRVADASLLDSVNRALIEGLAAENDFQVWLEVVDETKGVGFVIEDGSIAA